MSGEVAKIETKGVSAPVTPAQMLQIAVEQNADLGKLEKLMELQERWEASQAKKAYHKAMALFREDCPTIEKTRTGHNTKYAGLAETLQTIKGAMSDHGISHGWTTQQADGVISVTCTVTHIDGHSESTSLSAGADSTGSKNSIQAIGSTVSYLQRYTLFALLGLASQEMDTDGVPDTPEDVLEGIAAAKTLDELRSRFREAWSKYPKSRKELTVAKDIRKKELAND